VRILGMVSESPGRNASEPIGGPDNFIFGGRALFWRAKAAWTGRGLETESWRGLRHRQQARAAGNSYSPLPVATAPALDPTTPLCQVVAPLDGRAPTRRGRLLQDLDHGDRIGVVSGVTDPGDLAEDDGRHNLSGNFGLPSSL
jgi:hypothetical protein